MRALPYLSALTLVPALAACAHTQVPVQSAADASAEAPAAAPVVVYARIPSAEPPIQNQPEVPQPSPRAAVEQTVGVARVRVDYSSPAVRGRTIWGELVPHDQLWRAGANAPTRVELSEDATIFGATVPAGAYSLFMIPGETEFTVILNRDTSGRGYQAHDPGEDVARGTVTPTDVPARERLTYLFEDTTDTSTSLVLDWAGKRVAIPIEFDTDALVEARIGATLAQAWRPHFNAGRYYLGREGGAERALELLTRSNQIQATWWNEWFLAQALAALDRKAEARPHAERALELGAGDPVFEGFFAEEVRAALAEWQ